jgi:hypothetical protein
VAQQSPNRPRNFGQRPSGGPHRLGLEHRQPSDHARAPIVEQRGGDAGRIVRLAGLGTGTDGPFVDEARRHSSTARVPTMETVNVCKPHSKGAVMKMRARCALGATVMSLAALTSAGAAQAQPGVCSTRLFRAVDQALYANPRPVARVLGAWYRFAPRLAVADFDTLAQCDAAAALSVYNALQVINADEASAFKATFVQLYPVDAANIFGGGDPIIT